MTPQEQSQTTPARVSILARIAPALSFGLPALGAAISAWLFIGVMEAMRNAESAGIAAVAGGLSEANMAIVVTLYLAIFVGLAGVIVGIVRMLITTKAVSPSAWFFVVTGGLGLFPMFTLWAAQSLLIDVIFNRSPVEGGVSAIAAKISLLLLTTIVSAVIVMLILLASLLIPLPAFLRAKRKWAPVVALIVMEIIIVAMTVMYHVRTSWLWEQVEKY